MGKKLGVFRKLQHEILRRGKLSKTLSLIGNICGILSLVLTVLTIFTPYPYLKNIILVFVISFIVLTLVLVRLKKDLPFDDLEVRYTLTIENNEGDTWIQRDDTFINNSRSPVSEREHIAFSAGEPMEKFSDLKLEAWDSEGHTLNKEPIKDDPNYKKFIIKFNKAIQPSEPYTYGYKYFWSKFFFKKEEEFTAHDISPVVEFITKLKGILGLERMLCKEVFSDGRRRDCEEIERKEDNVNKESLLRVGKIERFNKVELLLTFEK